jgi:hypothetical protein
MGKEGVFMADWIKKAVLLNRTGICSESKIDRGNFDKFLLKGGIPKQHLDSIRPVIEKYGYKYDIKIQDANKPTNEIKPFEQPKNNFSIDTRDNGLINAARGMDAVGVNLDELTAENSVDKESVLNQIAEIRKQEIPKERNTPLGKKTWELEQEEKIKSLQKQLF